MKARHDLQPNVSPGIRDNSDDRADPFLIAQPHDFAQRRRTGGVHRFQPGKIRQETKIRRHLLQRYGNFFGATLDVPSRDATSVPDDEQPSAAVALYRVGKGADPGDLADWDPGVTIIAGSEIRRPKEIRQNRATQFIHDIWAIALAGFRNVNLHHLKICKPSWLRST
jgi:hypothetical protein